MNSRFLIPICLLALFADSTLLGQEPDPVRSTIEKKEAWMGETVPLIVTLISPGPFSGTAVFQIPEIPNTLIVNHGSPLVGSETVNGESMITQRHEFSIYTQQVGEVEIPAFSIEFESKNSFIGDAVARSGSTSALTFTSKRPPGTEAFPFVVSSATLKVEESWSPSGRADFDAGDILSRSITRNASDVSAMFLSPFPVEPIGGVRIYPSEPEVSDKRERGVASAKRIDTIKYQFERGGTFTIPEITTAWWNPKTEKIEEVKLPSLTVNVIAPPAPPKPIDKKRVVIEVLLVLAALVLLKRFLFPVLKRRHAAWHARRHSPEAEASRALLKACRRNESREAYAALMDWRRAVGFEVEMPESLRVFADALSRHLFSREFQGTGWNGAPLLAAFGAELRRRKRSRTLCPKREALPPLNRSAI